MGMDVILEIFLRILVNSEIEISNVAILAKENEDKQLKFNGIVFKIMVSK